MSVETGGFTVLILARRIGETVMIGDEVTITVLGVKGNQVRIGIDAPKSVAVHREEVYERIQRERAVPVVATTVRSMNLRIARKT